ncbi:MAG: hypothetical protein Ct9H300mP14_05390 [Gammaproteobacteria bacterium]|nr:MAG: hypothetical protein Ct9H300mP14_05390 [Gammaproteobacteria bacterium]
MLYPPWTTDWITDQGRKKFSCNWDYASGVPRPARKIPGETGISCPRCGSDNTSVLSSFGATACKALWRCDQCLEPFDYFKNPLVSVRFHVFSVAEVRSEKSDTVSVAFEVPDQLRHQYRFVQGEHLTLRRTFSGTEIRRSYSICSSVDEDELRIAVKGNTAGKIF